MRRGWRWLLVVVVLAGLAPVLPVAIAVADDAVVLDCSDDVGISNALATVQDGGGGTITFACSGTIPFSGEQTITSHVTILGGGNVTFDGQDSTRLFLVEPGATLELDGLTLQHAQVITGGAISSDGGTVTVTASTFIGNSVTSIGGAISSVRSSVTVTASTFSDNHADISGGAIFNGVGSTLKVTASTFSGNSADQAGGGAIGGIGSVTVTASTFSDNRAISGGAVSNAGTLILQSTIMAGSIGGNCFIFGPGISTSNGYNLSDDASCSLNAIGDISNSGSVNLGPLRDNGGPTSTMLPQADSAALEVIPPDACATLSSPVDQRGVSRPQGINCEIGAVELAGPTISTPALSPAPSDEGQTVNLSAGFTRFGLVGTATCAIDWGDGSAPEIDTVEDQGGAEACVGSHTYLDDAAYTVTVEVCIGTECSSDSAEHSVTNLPPVIESITTDGPVAQGDPITVTVNASDPGVNDILSYRFDCDDDGNDDFGPQASNSASCPLDPARASTTIRVVVEDEDGGSATGSVTVNQTVALCANRFTGALTTPGASGCPNETVALTLPEAGPTTLCINPYTGALTWTSRGTCGTGQRVHVVPDDGPLMYCQSLFTGQLRYTATGQCGAYERAGVIPGA